ncbi:hypothetical protein PTKIN_Ptkin07bG0295100 [Pterospermum kingtungense]
MDLKLKQAILDDLDRFISRKEFYKKIGKAWKKALLGVTNKFILVFEDIDSNSEVKDRSKYGSYSNPYMELKRYTISGILNAIDGLWSSCGDERIVIIVIFTTNHKDKLDPALLRRGRMDMHINMSYCSNQGFQVLASNYLDLHGQQTAPSALEVTPASLAEELLKSSDVDVAFSGVVNFLKRKAMERQKIEKKVEPRRSKRRRIV